MCFKINGLKWEVQFVDEDNESLTYNGEENLGVTYFGDLEIFLSNNMSDELCEQTVAHELAHAFLFSYGIHLPADDQEAVCDFVGAYFSKIYKLTNRIIKNFKHGKEVR